MDRPAFIGSPKSAAMLGFMIAACIVVGLGVAAGRSGGGAGGPKPEAERYFTPETIDNARRYTRPRYVAGFVTLAVGVAAVGALGLTVPGRAVGEWAGRIAGGRWPLAVLILAGAVTLIPAVLTLPLDAWRGFFHERQWGVSTQSFAGWLADNGKAVVFQAAVVAVAGLGFFLAVRRLPRAWPFAAGGLLSALTVLLVLVYPLVYEPLFNKFTPADPATKDRIVALATKAGVRVDRVLVADASRRTTKLNAYVSGLGVTKRVVLYDTLLQRSTEDEVDVIVAHELGHVVHNDVWKGTLLGCVGAVGAALLAWVLLRSPAVLRVAGAEGAGDPRALPMLAFAFMVATVLTLPIANGLSRRAEASADRFAVRLTQDPVTAVRVEVKLAIENIADLHPNGFIRWMFFTHPDTMERIGIALEEGRARLP